MVTLQLQSVICGVRAPVMQWRESTKNNLYNASHAHSLIEENINYLVHNLSARTYTVLHVISTNMGQKSHTKCIHSLLT